MNFSSLSASDKRILILGAVVAVIALISFLDPSGSWGAIMALTLLAGLGAAFIAVQPQMAPSMKLPAPKGLSLLVVGAVAAGATAIAILTYIGYISRNLTDIYVWIMIVGLVAAIVLLWTGWTAYKAEGGEAAAPAAPPPPAPPAAPPPPAGEA